MVCRTIRAQPAGVWESTSVMVGGRSPLSRRRRPAVGPRRRSMLPPMLRTTTPAARISAVVRTWAADPNRQGAATLDADTGKGKTAIATRCSRHGEWLAARESLLPLLLGTRRAGGRHPLRGCGELVEVERLAEE